MMLMVFDLQGDMFVWWYLMLQRLEEKIMVWGFRRQNKSMIDYIFEKQLPDKHRSKPPNDIALLLVG